MRTYKRLRRILHSLEIPAVFVTALFCRLYFNLFVLEHRVTQFGDAFYFLNAGTQLLAALKTGTLHELVTVHPAVASGIQAMTSLSLVDRLLIDGPVFPAYLAVVQFAIGINTALPHLDAHTVQISMLNCVLDALSCVLVYVCARLAFNRRTAVGAGFLMAFYPPAIINTASCYSEQFCYFLMVAWTISLLYIGTLPPAKTKIVNTLAWLAVGLLSGIVMLAKPALVLLPPLVAVIFAFTCGRSLLRSLGGIRKSESLAKPDLLAYLNAAKFNIAALLLGLATVILPWVSFTAAATGKPTLVVNRVPAFNFYIGNHLSSDGWRQYPLPYTPTSMPEALGMVASDVSHHPVEFIALELRKSTRLWSGAWNTFQYSFILDSKWQDVWHQFLLFAALLGFLFCAKTHSLTASRQGKATIVISTIVLFHFVYLGFEPISRYAVTAMPFICILAAYALSHLVHRQEQRRFNYELVLILVGTAAFLAFRRFSPSLMPYLISATGTWRGLAYLDAAVWVVSWLTILALCVDVVAQQKSSTVKSGLVPYTALGIASVVSLLVLLATSQFGASRYEWQCNLGKNQRIEQTIMLPRSVGTAAAYLLMDVHSSSLTPPLIAYVNGKELGSPMPWWQFSGDNKELVSALSVQAQAMGTNVSSYRQWWTVPIPQNLLIPGADNKIELKLAADADDSDVTIYGDYPFNFSNRGVWLPSMSRTSWTKAFATVCRGDARLYEWLQPQGRITNARLYFANKPHDDLSVDAARQLGNYRLRLLAFNTTKRNESALVPNRTVFATPLNKEIPILGSDPRTFQLASVPLGTMQTGMRYSFDAAVRSPIPGDAYVSVVLSGTSQGRNIQWTSPWQPGCLLTSKRWTKVTFSDFVDADLVGARDVKATILVSPFQSDILFLKKKQALRRSMFIKNVTLQFSAPHLVHGSSDLAFDLF